jgi:prepilin-type N-terminal cleavage/methylation domain-containing protein
MFMKSRRSGFTLPEILVTVTVIAVLAAVVVPAVTQYASKGDAPSAKSDVLQLSTAVTAFASDVRYYPGDLRQLTTLIATSGSSFLLTGFGSAGVSHSYAQSDVSKWKGPYTPSTLSASGYASLAGLQVQLGPDITVSTDKWLQVAIQAIANTALVSPGGCSALLALDQAIDGPGFGATDATTGQVQWTTAGTCTGSTLGAFSAPVLRLIPAP